MRVRVAIREGPPKLREDVPLLGRKVWWRYEQMYSRVRYLKRPIFEIFARSPLPVQNVLLKRRVTGRGVLDCMLYPQDAFILTSRLWHGKGGQTRVWGWLFF